jgi:hypothetical protein
VDVHSRYDRQFFHRCCHLIPSTWFIKGVTHRTQSSIAGRKSCPLLTPVILRCDLLMRYIVSVANLIFHPVIFQLESSYGWRFAYMVLAALMVFVGLPAAVTFQPPHQDEHDIENATKVVISHDEQRNTTSVNSSSHSDSKVTKPSVSDPAAAAAAGPTAYDGTDEVTALCDGYDKQSDQTYQTHIKTLLCSLWLIASTLKSIGYYVPILTLVRLKLQLYLYLFANLKSRFVCNGSRIV